MTYAAYRNEKPILSGGRPITGWKQTDMNGKRLWTAEIPAVREGKWYFHELWIDGHRRPRARQPNQGYYRVSSVPDLDGFQPTLLRYAPQRG